MSDFIFDVINTVVSGIALVASIASLAIHRQNYKKSKFKLDVFFDDRDCFYFDALDMAMGNRESLVTSVRIVNSSNQPLNISDIQLYFGEDSFLSATTIDKYPYPEHLPAETFATLKDKNGYLHIKSVDGDGYHLLDLKNNLIKTPLYLNAYDSIQGFLLFPHAGESQPETTIRIITSRGNADVTHTFMSKENHEKSFDYGQI